VSFMVIVKMANRDLKRITGLFAFE
jgi:hypothetical protein